MKLTAQTLKKIIREEIGLLKESQKISITPAQFADAVSALGHDIDKRFVKLTSIKELGKYDAEVRLHRSITVTVPFNVIAE